MSLRAVKSPLAPKMTMLHGSLGRRCAPIWQTIGSGPFLESLIKGIKLPQHRQRQTNGAGAETSIKEERPKDEPRFPSISSGPSNLGEDWRFRPQSGPIKLCSKRPVFGQFAVSTMFLCWI